MSGYLHSITNYDVESSMIVDSLTHILPPYFLEHREDAIARDTTFRRLFSNPKARIVQVHDLIDEMEKSGVDRSVIAGFGWTDPDLAKRSNDYLLESASEFPDLLIPLCSVNPIWPRDTAPKEVERCLKAGARGIGELHADTQGWVAPPYDALADTMSAAQNHAQLHHQKIFVVVHGSEPIGHTYPGKGTMTPDRLLLLAERFPDNSFVYSHFGGGLPLYEHMPEVAKSLSNVAYDSAATPFLYDPDIYTSIESATGADRIFFASDFPLMSQRRALNHLRKSELSARRQNMILEAAGRMYDCILPKSNS